jgi:hypothetical protein
VGRPSKFNEETRSKVLDALRAGVYPSTAAEFAGVSYETFRTWMRNGEADRAAELETDFAAFSALVGQVMATTEVRAIGLIQKAAFGDWRAAAWWAEHALPAKYGRKDAHLHAHAGAVAGDVDVVDLLGGREPVDVSLATREQILLLLEQDDARRIRTSPRATTHRSDNQRASR